MIALSWVPWRLGRHLAWRLVWRLAQWGVALVVVAMVLAMVAAPGAHGQILDRTQDAYRVTARQWLGPLSAIARRLFVLLATLEIAVSGLWYALRRESPDEIAARFLLKFIMLAVVLLLITSAGTWLPPIVNGFARAGEIGSGSAFTIGPSGIVDLGLNLALHKIDLSGLPFSFGSIATALFAVATVLVILLSFLLVAVIVMLTWVEAYVALAGGVLFLGLGAFRATAAFAENYLGFLFYIGIRLFFLYLLLGLGTSLITSQIAALPPATTPEQMAEVLSIAVTFAAIIVIIPRTMASRIAGSSGFGLAAALRSL
ncbi:MAG: P-type conjugative transfer protein TrbL [Gemmatimonadaceae bacterium]|nr:P-type conjugative transfer protein TrbL [Gemmatimonadaceae bacterium]